MLILKSNSYSKIINSIHTQNIPEELSKFLKEAKTMVVLENEEDIIEVRDRLNKIIKWEENTDIYDMDKENANKELERREKFRIETFEKLGKILPSLWL